MARLVEQVERTARREAKATEARSDLQREIREAHAEGASVRVIAEVVGLSPARVQVVLHSNPDQ